VAAIDRYFEQVRLILRALPAIAREECFALKGGTALNLFVRELPRLSVDIDLTYVPVEPREKSLDAIDAALNRIAERITHTHNDIRVERLNNVVSPKVLLHQQAGLVKIEPNTVWRGTVYESVVRETVEAVETLFESSASISVLSLPDLYGGKIVAALDRQHPRDLFDVKLLLDAEGITTEIRKAFIVYLCGHDRSFSDLLYPHLKPIKDEYERDFAGMTRTPVTVQELENARDRLIFNIKSALTQDERAFLLSFKRCEPDWALLMIQGIDQLPALRWKLFNLQKLQKNQTKHEEMINRLRGILEI
jgi:predicted nucleotidyltransferase component of viral defense system